MEKMDKVDKVDIKKIDENTISVIKNMPTQFSFTIEYLKTQRLMALEQKEREIAQKDLEIAEIDFYLAECKKLDIKEKPEEIIEENHEEIIAN